jgi:hypothetical protein
MKKGLLFAVFMFITLAPDSHALFFSYPRDGSFKQQSIRDDVWYYNGGSEWTIQAPDKWQHMMGSYASTEVLGIIVDDELAGGIVFGLGLLKEVEDGFREGWSVRDVFMDAAGVGASLLNSEKYKVWCDWKENHVQLKLSIALK